MCRAVNRPATAFGTCATYGIAGKSTWKECATATTSSAGGGAGSSGVIRESCSARALIGRRCSRRGTPRCGASAERVARTPSFHGSLRCWPEADGPNWRPGSQVALRGPARTRGRGRGLCCFLGCDQGGEPGVGWTRPTAQRHTLSPRNCTAAPGPQPTGRWQRVRRLPLRGDRGVTRFEGPACLP